MAMDGPTDARHSDTASTGRASVAFPDDQTRVLRAMYEAGRRFASTLEPDEIYDALRVLVYDHLPCDGLIVSTYDEKTRVARCVYVWVNGKLDPSALPPLTLDPGGSGMQGEVVRTRRGRVFNDVQKRTKGPGRFYDVGKDGKPRDLKASGAPPASAKCAIMVPILREDHVEGIVQIMSDTPCDYGDAQLAILEGLVSPIGVALRNAELYADARRELEVRRQVEASLRESEERSSLAQAAGGIGVWDWNATTKRTHWSNTMWEIYGLPPAQGGPPEGLWEALVHPEDGPRVQEQVDQLRASGATEIRSEFRIVRPDGVVRWIEAVGRIEHGPDGSPTRMSGVNIDITRRKEAEESLRTSAREKDEFLAMLGHELRNPLAPIRNAVEVLALVGSQDPQSVQMRGMIERQVTHMSRLLDDLLDVARIARSKMQLRRERTDLTAVVRDVVDDHRPALAEQKITLSAELPQRPAWVNGDPTRLAQVIGNLLHNARKFTDPGGRIDVHLETHAESAEATLHVRDTGIGIAPEALPRIFDAFSQVGENRNRDRHGLGLGLAVAKGLVQLHGGTLIAASDGPGQGASFAVRLPLDATAPEEPGTSETAARGPASLRILVIEDNPDSAESQRLLLRLRGHDVDVAHDGADGITRARATRPDVVLCDIGLPGIDGYGVAQDLRRHPETRDCYLIAQSGYGMDRDRTRALEAGFDLHLRKPVNPVDLDQILSARLPAIDRT